MGKLNSVAFFGVLVAVVVAMAGAALMKDGLYIARHEGDMLHMMEIVFRLADGEMPHRDFMTPIGFLAFWPVALFVRLGYGIGHAAMYSQVLVAICLLPAVWWVGVSRLRGVLPYLFGGVVMVLVLALVHGEATRAVSFSMHYNRWAWACAYVVITLAVVPPKIARTGTIDGIIIGVLMALLVLSKVTYFAAFIVPVILSLILRGNLRAIAVAALSGLAVAAVVTLTMGVDFWFGYVGDLLTVARSNVRPNPGEPLDAVIAAPAYLGGSLVAVLAVIFLRQSRERIGGLVLFTFLPAFFYVTYQNFANDPQWLLLLAVLLLAMLPKAGIVNGWGWDTRVALLMTAAALCAFAMPSFLNLTFSPFRHLNLDEEEYTALLPNSALNSDLKTVSLRALRVDGRIAMDGPGGGLEAYAEKGDRDPVTLLNGESLPQCELELGLSAWFTASADDLDQAGFAEGKRIMVADLFSSHWLFGTSLRLIGGAPWYYGGLSGFDSADYVLVPLCAVAPPIREKVLKEIEERTDVKLTEVRRTPLYILLEKTPR